MKKDSMVSTIFRAPGVRPAFPPDIVLEVKALACELPAKEGIPLSRFSSNDIAREVIKRGIVTSISGTTIWRWLNEDAIKPWRYRSWVFPRDPDFKGKAGPVLDLYQGVWNGKALGPNDYVISADEKTSIQARIRKHETEEPEPGQSMKVEAEYTRGGAWAYLAAWDVHRAKIFGRCESKTGIKPFGRLVDQVMSQEPYCESERVFWIVDNGSSHRGEASVERLQSAWPNIIPVHLPVHASWLNQIEIYFSIVQRKVLTPNDVRSLQDLKARILAFEPYYEQIATPFEWKFTRKDLNKMLRRLRPNY